MKSETDNALDPKDILQAEDITDWASLFKSGFNEQNHVNGISLNFNFPKIRRGKSREDESPERYISSMGKEWMIYRKLMQQTPVIREINLSYDDADDYQAANVRSLLDLVLKKSIVHPKYQLFVKHLVGAKLTSSSPGDILPIMVLGLGARAISDTGNFTAKNFDNLVNYNHTISIGQLPVEKIFAKS